MLKYDEANLRDTAKVVRKLNKYVADMTVEQLVAAMKRTASSAVDRDLGYVTISGYVLTFYRDAEDHDVICVYASVATYTAMTLLNR